MKNLCLKNTEGKVVRFIPVPETNALLIVRNKDDQRLLFRAAEEKELLVANGWEVVKEFDYSQVATSPIKITQGLSLAPCDTDEVKTNIAIEEQNEKSWRNTAISSLLVGFILMFALLQVPAPEPKELEEELKQQVVKIVKMQKPEPMKLVKNSVDTRQTVTKVTNAPKVKSTQALKRMGALGVLGSLKNSNQQGGLNLGAVKTSAGPGLGGGTQGSGGVQTSLYGKGIVSAPLGVGGNLKGAGGYGTKGKGGGQAGYGTLSLVGSAGTSVIPVGQEVIAGGGGLDQADIFAVIKRNQGQIRFCYEQGLQSNPNLKGRVTTAFTIGGNGQVKVVNIANSTMNSKIVEDCIALRIKTWKFPLPQGGTDVSVKIPFDLNRQGRG